MKLVTFRRGDDRPRSGVLIEDGAAVIDLAAAYQQKWHGAGPVASVLEIAEAGANGLCCDLASQATPCGTRLARSDIRLDAPIPRRPQMRDFLCFEKHLVQAFE